MNRLQNLKKLREFYQLNETQNQQTTETEPAKVEPQTFMSKRGTSFLPKQRSRRDFVETAAGKGRSQTRVKGYRNNKEVFASQESTKKFKMLDTSNRKSLAINTNNFNEAVNQVTSKDDNETYL